LSDVVAEELNEIVSDDYNLRVEAPEAGMDSTNGLSATSKELPKKRALKKSAKQRKASTGGRKKRVREVVQVNEELKKLSRLVNQVRHLF
jgi:hypothetical protein